MEKIILGTDFKYLNLPTFQGFPYIWSRLVPSFYHLILLPRPYSLTNLVELARFQASANKLPTCLVLEHNKCIYYYSDGNGQPSEHIPRGGFIQFGRLRPPVELLLTEELVQRNEALKAFQNSLKRDGYLTGDLSKGGHRATLKELQKFGGMPPKNGVPTGLAQCSSCGDWKGECLDPNPHFRGWIMQVHCLCDNDNLCAFCGESLIDRKLNANYYSLSENVIWHVPGFSGLQHKCHTYTGGRVC